MKKQIYKYTIFILIFSLFLPYLPVLAAEDTSFNPDFLITDEEMQNWQSMTREDIQAFLKHYNSFLSGYTSPDVTGLNRTASDIIYRASSAYKINPKYLLVKLQKEQSLITSSSPTQKQLDWATGYGICDSCSMSDPALQKYKGFGVQTDNAAGIIRWYYDNLNNEGWIKRKNSTYTIDGINVRPMNLATAFLYTYTPHIHGNKNFWNLWQKWFEQVYPNGSLVKGANSPTIYLIKNGEKKPFANMSALATRFDQKFIITIPETELKNYTTGSPISLPNYSILRAGGNYYLLNNDSVRPFESYNTVKELGYNPDEIIDITAAEINSYNLGKVISTGAQAPLGRLVKVKENKQIYYIEGNNFYSVTDEKIAKTNYPHLAIDSVGASELAKLTQGDPIKFKDGILFGITGSNKIYVSEDGKKRHIASEEVFNGMGFNWKNIIWTDEFTGLNHPTGQPIYIHRNIEIAQSESEDDTATTQSSAPDPINDKMIYTPSDKTTYIGKEFSTDVNTYLVADYKTGEILAGKNIDDVRPMASFAKVMTAYELMKEGVNLSRSSTYDPADHKSIYATFRIAAGEKILNKNLLYSGLVSSLNTPMKMLVDSVEEKESKFIERMNTQAQNWLLDKTIFVDVTGEDLRNKTTARDYLSLYTKATKNVDINDFLSTKSYEYNEMVDKDGNPRHYDDNSNLLFKKNNLSFNIINSKTGYLDEAGAGLAMIIEKKTDSKKFVIITMGNPDYPNRFFEPQRLAEWAVNNF